MCRYLKMFYTNADSLRNKLHELKATAHNEDLDIICITETLPKTNRTLDMGGNLNIDSYTNYDVCSGRGITLFIHERLKSELYQFPSDFEENVWVTIELGQNTKLLVGGIYRSPNSTAINNDKLLKLLKHLEHLRNFNIIIMGDFNYKEVNWKQNTVNAGLQHPASLIFHLINDLFLDQMVLEPTRHRSGQTANTLDWVLTNFPEKVGNLKILAPLGEKGDHNVIMFEYEVPPPNTQSDYTSLCFSQGDYESINKSLDSNKWEDILNSSDLNHSWQLFQETLLTLIKKFVPQKNNRRSNKKQPWVNREVKEALKRKNKAWKIYRQNKSDNTWSAFTQIRNNTNRIIRKRKAEYEQNLAQEIKANPKKFWNYLNLKRKTNRDLPKMLDKDNKEYITDYDIANQFNEYFSEVFTTENLQSKQDLPNRAIDCTLEKISISPEIIAKELKKVNISKSPGPDQLHSRILYETRDHIIKPLTHLFQQSLKEGKLPSIWKKAHIRPIHKKGNKNQFCNYRPVSLTSVCGKLLERIIRDQLVHYLESNKLIHKDQHGFRAGRSCTTQLLEVMETWTELIDKGIPFDCIYLDFAKAFDKVPHRRLINKIEAYGIKGDLLRWISDFLSNRTQLVRINDSTSTPRPVKSGIPQGSVLGPILFIIFINDLPDSIKSSIKIFADDTKIFRAAKTTTDRDNLQIDLNNLFKWTANWQLPFNIDKCKLMHYGSGNQHFSYYLNNRHIDTDSKEKDLGVTFDDSLKFAQHMGQIVAKANSRLGLIRNTFTELPPKTLLPLYKSLVRPLLEYAVAVWKPHLKKDIDSLERVQRRATKLITGLKHLSYPERLKSIRLDSLQFRRRRNDMLQVFRIFRKLDNLDPTDFFAKADNSVTRGHSCKLIKPRANTHGRLQTFSHRVINDWNDLSQSTIDSNSLNTFKTALGKEWANHPDRFLED